MRNFDTYEKEILRRIRHIEKLPGSLNNIGNVIDADFYPYIYVDLKVKDHPIKVTKAFIDQIAANGYWDLADFNKQLNNKFVSIVNLFKYLKEQGELDLIGNLEFETLGSKTIGETYVGIDFEDKQILEEIFDLSKKRIIVRESLIKYVDSNFKTEKELLAEKEFKKIEEAQKKQKKRIDWTMYGVLIALGSLISTNVIEITKLNKDETTKIKLINDTFKIKSEVDTLKVNMNQVKDTIKIKL
jgi:hypothetical protein